MAVDVFGTQKINGIDVVTVATSQLYNSARKLDWLDVLGEIPGDTYAQKLAWVQAMKLQADVGEAARRLVLALGDILAATTMAQVGNILDRYNNDVLRPGQR